MKVNYMYNYKYIALNTSSNKVDIVIVYYNVNNNTTSDLFATEHCRFFSDLRYNGILVHDKIHSTWSVPCMFMSIVRYMHIFNALMKNEYSIL